MNSASHRIHRADPTARIKGAYSMAAASIRADIASVVPAQYHTL